MVILELFQDSGQKKGMTIKPVKNVFFLQMENAYFYQFQN